MKSISISGTARSIGKKEAKALRREGMVPCVIYGGEKEVYFSADERAFKNLIYTTEARTADIELDGTTIKAIVKDVQFHPVTDSIVHIDFLELQEDRPVTMAVPVRLVGNAIGVRNGGKLRQVLRQLDVRAIPSDLPDAIELNIEKMRIGTKLSVGDVQAGSKFEILNSEKAIIVAVRRARGAMDEDEEDEEGEGGEEGEGAEASSEESSEA
jgi:large subunit ribosomal protein L25